MGHLKNHMNKEVRDLLGYPLSSVLCEQRHPSAAFLATVYGINTGRFVPYHYPERRQNIDNASQTSCRLQLMFLSSLLALLSNTGRYDTLLGQLVSAPFITPTCLLNHPTYKMI